MRADKIDLVVFDAGGVLLRICRTWKEACARVGLPFHEEVMDQACLARRRELVRTYEIGGMTCEEFFPQLAASTDGRYSTDQARAIHRGWIIEEYPGVVEVGRELRERGVRTAVLSNTNAAHWATFPDFPVMGHIDRLFASHLLGVAKPDAGAFGAVGSAMNANPASILLFDDRPENIAGAKAAGWQTHLVDHTGDTAAQMRQALQTCGLL